MGILMSKKKKKRDLLTYMYLPYISVARYSNTKKKKLAFGKQVHDWP